jgi:GntR family transcriptional regulator, rspAB operon transcriptional repressor
MVEPVQLPKIETLRSPTTTDEVFEALYEQVVTLALPPGARLSEAEVARQMGVSRQPVRDAFYRLSKSGFLVVRPQRATIVSQISESSVRQASFIRTALELETVRTAMERLSGADLDELEALLGEQAEAVAALDRKRFHALDDAFHHQICRRSGLEFIWTLIRENKAHMDRVRFQSLPFGAETALEDHRKILAALKRRDPEAGALAIREHLGRIGGILEQVRLTYGGHFDEDV